MGDLIPKQNPESPIPKARVLVEQNQNKTKCRASRKEKESSFRLHGTYFQGAASAFFLAVDSLVYH